VRARAFAKAVAVALFLTGAAAIGAAAGGQGAPQVIKVSAKRFEYTPGVIRVKRGVPVILELTSEDVVMGFNAPDFGTRADILPGKTARVRIEPTRAGTYTFVCDIFCGTGHEDMSGTIVVEE
jgi:cytochrome c oxidase subunit 2